MRATDLKIGPLEVGRAATASSNLESLNLDTKMLTCLWELVENIVTVNKRELQANPTGPENLCFRNLFLTLSK
jgi:hypothetical protein